MGKNSKLKADKRKVFCVGQSSWDADWLPQDRYVVTKNYDEADVLVFPGGSDWNPALYNETAHISTGFHEYIDKAQIHYALKAIKDKKFMIGICRGGQMLCILGGGRLIQHVDHHAGQNHDIYTHDGKVLDTNSIHHQMMDTTYIPKQKDFKLLAWTTPLSNCYKTGAGEAMTPEGLPYREVLEKENEIIYFSKIGGFAIQGHPEMRMDGKTRAWIIDQIEQNFTEFKKNVETTKIPEYITKRISLVETTYFNTQQNITTNEQSTSKKNRDHRAEVTGYWDY